MSLRVHLLKLLCINVILNELGKVSLILGWIFFLQHLHVLLHMAAKNALLVGFGIILGILSLLFGWLETWEVLGTVGNVKSTIDGTFQSTPHPRTHTSAPDADVKNGLEWSLLGILILDVVLLSVQFLLTLEGLIKAKRLQSTAGDEQAGCIGSGVVLVAAGDAELGELIRACMRHDDIACNGGIRNLADNPLVRQAYNQPVLLVIELVLVLPDHLATGLEVSLALAATTLFHLVTFEERFILQDLDKCHDASALQKRRMQIPLIGNSVPRRA
mmetsp:Transcript_79931/g.147077  ORF Transcript_79931/g.147077 Transcript_79931/m.147077 type:complete len:273 (-) Transcript_79931:22-840(-)